MGRVVALIGATVLAWGMGDVARGQPGSGGDVEFSGGSGGGSGSGSGPPKSAGASAVESNDVPVWVPSPPRFAVAPFENHTNIRALDWIIAGAPFEIAEKTEAVLGLEPTGGTLQVSATEIAAEPTSVAAFAKAHAATYVVTGWFDRPNWELRLDVVVWKVTAGTARIAGEAQRQGLPATYHKLVGEALTEAWAKAGVPVDLAAAGRLQRPLAVDVYAVNLMGRGLGHLVASLAVVIPPRAPRLATPAVATAAERAILQAQTVRTVELRGAEHDLERTVFIDPKCYEAQRLLGELYLVLAQNPPGETSAATLRARATGKFNYATDLAPDDIGA
ncbi:MAG: hypothetical protein NT062_16505, partial [Proteobacteria bacterium]|nr:hypothetical protein [Pseudomonadota bacterium]